LPSCSWHWSGVILSSAVGSLNVLSQGGRCGALREEGFVFIMTTGRYDMSRSEAISGCSPKTGESMPESDSFGMALAHTLSRFCRHSLWDEGIKHSRRSAMQRRHALRDDQWERIKDALPGKIEVRVEPVPIIAYL
jgi:hypothetical protein